MATECRAKNPNTCRVHGNVLIKALQEQADQAATSGDIGTYMTLREQIDAAHEALDTLQTLIHGGDSHENPKVEAAAKAWYEKVSEGREWADETPETREEFRKDTEECLQAAEPYLKADPDGFINQNAVGATAKSIFVSNFGWEALERTKDEEVPAFDETPRNGWNTPYYRNLARTLLNAAQSN